MEGLLTFLKTQYIWKLTSFEDIYCKVMAKNIGTLGKYDHIIEGCEN